MPESSKEFSVDVPSGFPLIPVLEVAVAVLAFEEMGSCLVPASVTVTPVSR